VERPNPTHDARCLVIVARGVLERRIEDRARRIAADRGGTQVEPDDVRTAVTEVMQEDLARLSQAIEKELDDYTARKRSAA